MLNTIIFSKDRAMQLDSLLRSYFELFDDAKKAKTTVIYTSSSDEFNKAYDVCRSYFRSYEQDKILEFRNQKETSLKFKELVVSSIDQNNKYTMFLVDDIIFKENVSLKSDTVDIDKIFESKDVIAHSLRMGDGIVYCYPTSEDVIPPSDEMFLTEKKWDWRGKRGDWGYPLSVDGHVFETSFIENVVKSIEFSNPNNFEGTMAQLVGMGFFNHKPYMTCDWSILNIPANRVQDTALNRHGNLVSAEELNEQFLSGLRIDVTKFLHYRNNAPHIELPYVLEKDERYKGQ